MGFLDSLLRKSTNAVTNAAARAVGNAVGDVVEDAAQNLIRGLKNSGDDGKERETTISKPQTQERKTMIPEPKVQEPEPVIDPFEDMDVDKKLRIILAEEFPQYEVKEQVSPTTIGGEGQFLPYDFAVYQNGQPKLFIMVVFNNTCGLRKYRWSKEQAERAGVTMINFVFGFSNKKEYMIDRLHQYL